MRIDMQDTQPLLLPSRLSYKEETSEERFRRLKAFADATGMRYVKVYLLDERQRISMLHPRSQQLTNTQHREEVPAWSTLNR